MPDNLARELRELPERFGFANLTRFIDALRIAARHGAVQAPKSPSAGRKRYARVTPRIRAEVKRLAEAGKLTNAEMAMKLGISGKTLSTIKKELGLARPWRKPQH